MSTIWIIAVCALFAINIAATIALRRDAYLERSQKAFQIALIWVVPGLGALLSFFFRRIQATDPLASSGSEDRGEFAHELDLHQVSQVNQLTSPMSEPPPNDTP
jgi:hypothetical protein